MNVQCNFILHHFILVSKSGKLIDDNFSSLIELLETMGTIQNNEFNQSIDVALF